MRRRLTGSQKIFDLNRSPEWQRISSAEREKLGLTFEEDGEFWYVNPE